MAELATMARPYARAAFEAAREDGDDGLDRWSGMLALLGGAAEAPELKRQLASPSLTAAGKAQLLVDVLGDDLSEKGRNLVHLLAENKRLELAADIAEQYEELKDEFLKTLEVEVVSAKRLTKKDLDTLREKLAARFDKRVELTSRVDKTLLGGAFIRAGDTVIDGSIRGRLDRLEETLKARL